MLMEILSMIKIAPDMLFVDYLNVWLDDIEELLKPSSFESYDKVVHGKIIPYFAPFEYKLNELKGMHFTAYFKYLKNEGRSDGKGGLNRKAVNNIRGILSSAFTYALQNDLVEYNYIERSRMPVFDSSSDFEPYVYSPAELQKLLTAAEQKHSKACLFLYLDCFTGCRKGELMALSWDNVDFEHRTISIKKNRSGCRSEVVNKVVSPKSRNSIRTVAVPQHIIDMLEDEWQHQQYERKNNAAYVDYDYDFIIRKDNGSLYYPTSINRMINNLMLSIGLPHCRVHDIRHAVAQMLFDSDVPLQEVSIQLGHGESRTTERIYIKRKNVASENNARIISSILKNP